MPEKNEPLKLDFRNLIEKCDAKIVNPIRFEQKDSNGYPIWSFWLHDDDGLCSGCDYLLVSRLELIELIKSAVRGLIKDVEEDIVYWKKEMEEYEEKELNAKTEEERKKYDEHWKIAEQVYRVLNTRIKNLIKKWFPDVIP